MKSYLYIIQSLRNGSYYVGSTMNLKSRIRFHNSGRVKATKYKGPYKLVFCQPFDKIELARKAELKIKHWKRKDFIEKIIRDKKLKSLGL